MLHIDLIKNIENTINKAKSIFNKDLRLLALESLKKTTIPMKKHERWRYSNLHNINFSQFSANIENSFAKTNIPNANDWKAIANKFINQNSDNQINLYNGIYLEKYSKLEKEFLFSTLNNENKNFLNNIDESFFKKIEFTDALNLATLNDGFELTIPDNAKLTNPIYINQFINTNTGSKIATKNLINIKPYSTATIVENIINSELSCNLTTCNTEINVSEGANLNYYLIQNSDSKSINIINNTINQYKYSNLNIFILTNGNSINHTDFTINLLEPEANANNFIANKAKNNEVHNINLHVNHHSNNCKSNTIYRSVVKDKASSSFTGDIKVSKNAYQTCADLQCKSLTLSKFAEANAKPLLEINCDDVKCSHGATIGHLDEDAIFYLRSRGIELEDAKEMLVSAFIEPILNNIEMLNIRNFYENLIEGK